MSEDLESLLDAELKSTIDDVITYFKRNFKEYETLTTFDCGINVEHLEQFAEVYDIELYKDFIPQLTSPYSIGKYLILLQEERELIQKVDTLLKSYLDTSVLEWTIRTNFSKEIVFHRIVPEEKPQSLSVIYNYNIEEDKFLFSIKSNNWGWDITKNELKALLERKPITSIKTNETYSSSKEEYMKVCFNGMEISFKKL